MGLKKEEKVNLFLSDLVVNKKSVDNSYSEKPVFCDNGKSIIISRGKSCHLYNTSTGNHVKELFRCSHNVISHHLHPLEESLVIAITENGEVTVCNWKTNEINHSTRLMISGIILNKKRVSKFNLENEEETEFNWTDKDLNSPAHRKFIYADVKPLQGNPSKIMVWASWCLNDEIRAHVSVFSLQDGKHQQQLVLRKLRLKKCYLNFVLSKSQNLDAFAGISHNCLHVVHVENENSQYTARKHYTGFNSTLTCVTIHPTECCIATGDSIGRITIWKNIFDKYPLKEVFHWHSGAVRDVVFSKFGNYLFSGGEESVLVKWSVTARKKQFLPRLSTAICHLSEASEASLLAVLTSDSKILIVDFNFQCVSSIQAFSKWQTCRRDGSLGVFAIDPRSDCIVLNGQTGHIQFLSTREEGNLMYTFDVTNRNLINSHSTCTVSNTEVTHAAFGPTGEWLVTAESKAEPACEESRLKFWKYLDEKGSYVLNTNVEFPHGGNGIHSLEMSREGMVATTGPDKKFRLWTVEEHQLGNAVKEIWSVFRDRKYRHLPCRAVDFSKDSSLVAVTFASLLTVWETNSCLLKCSLSSPDRKEPLQVCRFGNNESTHLIVTGTESRVSCWNAITLSLVWTVPFQLSVLVGDPFSAYMAAFSADRTLIVFNPGSPSPELTIKDVCGPSAVVAAECALNASGKFRLFFLAENQDLYCLEDAEKPDETLREKPEGLERSGPTPYLAQVARKENRTDFSGEKVSVSVLKNNQRFVTDLLNSPAHTLSNPSLLCSQVLKGLLLFSLGKSKSASNRPTEGKREIDSKRISIRVEKTDAEANEETLMDIVKTIFV